MMKLCNIMPTQFIEQSKEDAIHMCLAHLVNSDATYRTFYKRQRFEGSYIIVDNSVIENDPQPIELVVKAAMSIDAQEIVLPDVLHDMDATLDKSLEALTTMKCDFPHFKTMAVPQGKTMEEWISCAKIMLEWPIDCIGIPKNLTYVSGTPKGRPYNRIHAIESVAGLIRDRSIHLLGCWTSPIELSLVARSVMDKVIPEVRSIDTAMAYIFTKAGKRIGEQDRPDIPWAFDDRDPIDRALLHDNIREIQKSLDVEPNAWDVI